MPEQIEKYVATRSWQAPYPIDNNVNSFGDYQSVCLTAGKTKDDSIRPQLHWALIPKDFRRLPIRILTPDEVSEVLTNLFMSHAPFDSNPK